MALGNYLKSVLNAKSEDSVKSLTLFLSAIVGALVGLVLCFVLVYDVVSNGYLKTDLTDAGIFLLCTGGYMAGAGIPKILVDRNRDKYRRLAAITGSDEDEDSEYRPRRRHPVEEECEHESEDAM